MLFILFTRRHVISVSTWSRDYNSLLSVSRMAEFRHYARARTHTHTPPPHTHTHTHTHTIEAQNNRMPLSHLFTLHSLSLALPPSRLLFQGTEERGMESREEEKRGERKRERQRERERGREGGTGRESERERERSGQEERVR